jgi:hypothetical protein
VCRFLDEHNIVSQRISISWLGIVELVNNFPAISLNVNWIVYVQLLICFMESDMLPYCIIDPLNQLVFFLGSNICFS